MLSFLLLCIRRFGFIDGIIIYCKIKVFRTGRIILPKLKSIYYRPGTSDVHTFREIFLREEYAIQLPSGFKTELIIDAGANIGFTTLFFSKQHPSARIISLEPDPQNFELLKKNTAKYPMISAIHAALWNAEGTISIQDEGYGVRGYMVSENKTTGTSMPATTLPILIKKFNIESIDVLKMDIEGSELEVFQTETEKWLPITKCLIIELHDRMKPGCSQAVFKALANYNFECSVKGENLVFINQGSV